MAIDDNTSYELTGYQVKDLASKVRAKADSSALASVATSGLYSDLTGAPTIPTVNNGTLTIKQNGTTIDTFTANASSDKTIDIETIYADTVAPASAVAPITTAMIQDEAVTDAKIAWSSMPYVTYTNTSQVSSLSTSYTNLYSIDISSIPTGAVFVAQAVVTLSSSGGSGTDYLAYLRYNSIDAATSSCVGTWGQTLTLIGVFTKVSGVDTLYVRGMVAANPNSAWLCNAVAYRIA